MSGAGSCHVCGTTLVSWFERLGRQVCRCGQCGHVQVPAGVQRLADGTQIYEAPHAEIFEGEGNVEYYFGEGAVQAAQAKVEFVSKYVGTGLLLDVGSSFGHFLAAASPRYDAHGLEPNPSAVEWGNRELGVRSTVGSAYDVPPQLASHFDVITMWDVIEHLDNPRSALQACRERLQPGGWLFLSTPDAGSLSARITGARWHYQDPVQHINLFSRRNLSRLLHETGFEVRGHVYFGRQYRVAYVLHRLRYLIGAHSAGHVLDALKRLPAPILRASISIKLWDVMGLAAQVKDKSDG